jgi:hypothetical protein
MMSGFTFLTYRIDKVFVWLSRLIEALLLIKGIRGTPLLLRYVHKNRSAGGKSWNVGITLTCSRLSKKNHGLPCILDFLEERGIAMAPFLKPNHYIIQVLSSHNPNQKD